MSKMRQNYEKQLPLSAGWPDHNLSRELRVISNILDSHPGIYDKVLEDITQGKRTDRGSCGMSAEQVLRCAILKRMHGFSYEKLSFHLADSESFQEFARIGYRKRIKRSTLQDNISKITAETWEQINRVIITHAKESNIEKGRKVRGDCTVIETHIHTPHDSGQLWDCVRVVTRTLVKLNQGVRSITFTFQDHRRRARKRHYSIVNSTKANDRKKFYRDLLTVAEKTYIYGVKALEAVGDSSIEDERIDSYITRLGETLELMVRVIDQTKRRVFKGEKVTAGEKVVSIFEPHTDIIVKKYGEALFGHKVALMVGKSSLILDCMILKGNPGDESLAIELVERQEDIWGRVPRQIAFDGKFASKHNLMTLKDMGVKDVSFSKKRGMKVSEMVKSSWVYKQLHRFRAGVEGCISTLKRVFNLSRCDWRGLEAFESYVWSGVVTYNLVVLARHLLA
jgi:IS5 family transposase